MKSKSGPRHLVENLIVLAACLTLQNCGASDGPVQPPPGSQGEEILVIARTVGDDQDLDGYSLIVDGRPGVLIGPNEQLTVPDLAVAFHAFQLTGIEANCRHTTVDRTAGSNTYTLNVFCLPPNSGRIYYTEDSQFLRLSAMNAIGGDNEVFGPSYVRDFSVSTDDLPPRVVPHPMLVPASVEGREGRASSGTRATA